MKKFDTDKWFSGFISKWLDHLADRTLSWVGNAVKVDSFQPSTPPSSNHISDADHTIGIYSSSISDIFTAILLELDLIAGLCRYPTVQNARFSLKFAKVCSEFCSIYEC
jgi:hypothetical protein